MPLKHHHGGHRGRLRTRFRKNPDSFEDHELLELLLFYAIPQKDTNALAHDLLHRFGSIAGIVNANPDQISEVPGMGETSSQLFPVVLEVLRRYFREQLSGEPPVDYDPKHVGAYCFAHFFGKTEEHILAMALNSDYSVFDQVEIGQGDCISATIDTVRLSKFAHRNNPRKIVVAHNHPSGIALPSAEDFKTTDFLQSYLLSCGCSLLDHLIFDGRGDFVSLGISGQLNGKNRCYYEVRQEENPSGEIRFVIRENPLMEEFLTKNQTSEDNT